MNRETDQPEPWCNPFHVKGEPGAKLAAAQQLGAGLRRKVNAGWALGTFIIEMPTPACMEAMALAGFDFVVVDMEHSAVDFASLRGLIAAGHAAGIPVLVRPWSDDAGLMGKILDVGANGLMVPRMETPEQARAVVEQTRFPPAGNRGFSPLTRYDALEQPLAAMNEATMLVLQIEGESAVKRAADIAAIAGPDVLFIGPYDLALSMGVPPGSPEVYAAADKLAQSLPKSTRLGIYVDDPGTCGDWAGRGFSLQCAGYDGRMLAGAARALVAAARRGAKGKDRSG